MIPVISPELRSAIGILASILFVVQLIVTFRLFRADDSPPATINQPEWIPLGEAIAFAATGRWLMSPQDVKSPLSKWRMRRAIARIEDMAREGSIVLRGTPPPYPWKTPERQDQIITADHQSFAIDAAATLAGDARTIAAKPFDRLRVKSADVVRAFG